jgi:hypothetical protein
MESQGVLIWQKYRKFVFLAVVLTLMGGILYFVATHGFVTISLSGAGDAEDSLVLLNQTSNRSSKSSFNTTVRKLVRKADYEATVRVSGASSWAQFKTKGFLQNTTITMSLQKERARTFIADNPSSCMSYNSQLVSFSCGSIENIVNVHNQSSGSVPPLVSQGIGDIPGTIDAIITTPSGTVAFVEQLSEDESNPTIRYSFVPLASSTFQVSGTPILLTGVLDSQTEYSAKAYRGGIIVYSKDFSSLVYFSKPQSSGDYINLPDVTGGLRAFDLQASDKALVVSYTNRDLSSDNSLSKVAKGTRSASTVLENGKAAKTYYYNGAWATVLPCGNAKLCATSPVGDKQQMSVYDTSTAKLQPEFNVNNVNQMFGVNGNISVVTDEGVLRLDPTKKRGSFDISFLGDHFCGSGDSNNPTQYVLCVTSSDGNHALLIDTTIEDTNQINQRVNVIRANKMVQKIIVDRNKVFIVPDYGNTILNQDTGESDYDPALVQAANQTVKTLVTQQKLKELGFTVINVLE